MLVKNYEKKDNKVFFQVEVNAEAFDKALSAAYKRVKGSIQVPGSRKGKVPRRVVESLYEADVFHEMAVAELAPGAFDFAVKTEKIKNIGNPSLIDYKAEENGSVVMSFSTEIYPEVTLGQYKSLEVVYEEHEISEKELEVEIEAVKEKYARYAEVEKLVENGGIDCFLDFEGFAYGVAFEGGKAEDYSLEVGSGSFRETTLPELDDDFAQDISESDTIE